MTYRRDRTRYRWGYGPDRARSAALLVSSIGHAHAAVIYAGVGTFSGRTGFGPIDDARRRSAVQSAIEMGHSFAAASESSAALVPHFHRVAADAAASVPRFRPPPEAGLGG